MDGLGLGPVCRLGMCLFFVKLLAQFLDSGLPIARPSTCVRSFASLYCLLEPTLLFQKNGELPIALVRWKLPVLLCRKYLCCDRRNGDLIPTRLLR